MITSNFSVPNAALRTQLSVPGTTLAKSLQETELNDDNADDFVVISADSGQYHLEDKLENVTIKEGEALLPLRFGPLQQAVETIETKQAWLLDHEPVIKQERDGQARIDFINYGGFVFSEEGSYISHSVNPW